MSAPQYFTTPDSTEMVIITRKRYEALLEAEEDAEDLAAAYEARQSVEREGAIPAQVSRDARSGINPVAAWRKYRAMSQAQLAELAGVTQAAIARIESGPAGTGRDDTLQRIAKALGAPVAHINPPPATPRDGLRKTADDSADRRTGRSARAAR